MSLRSRFNRRRSGEEAVTDLERVVSGTRSEDLAGVNELAELLLRHDRRGEAATGAAALRLVARKPSLLLALDQAARGASSMPAPGWTDVARDRLQGRTGGLVAMALASSHRDGRVREAAVNALLDFPLPELLPYVALRAADWVPQVRDRARAGLALALYEPSAPTLELLIPVTLRLSARWRGRSAHRQTTAALMAAPPPMLRAVMDSARGRARRLVFDCAVATGALDQAELLKIALSDPEWRIRGHAAEIVARDAVWTRRLMPLEELARSVTPPVRVLGLAGLDRLDRAASSEEHLADASGLVRAFARAVHQRQGGDCAAFYRGRLAAASVPAPGLLAGLGECGSHADASAVAAWLDHPHPAGRREAVRALGRLGGLPKDRAVALLTDPSAAVVREASAALSPLANGLSPEPLEELLRHSDRFQVRGAAYTVLRESRGWPRLRAALIAAVDGNPELAQRGFVDATWWARRDEIQYVPRRALRQADLEEPLPKLTSEEHRALAELATAAAPVMSPYALDKLTRHLDEHLAA